MKLSTTIVVTAVGLALAASPALATSGQPDTVFYASGNPSGYPSAACFFFQMKNVSGSWWAIPLKDASGNDNPTAHKQAEIVTDASIIGRADLNFTSYGAVAQCLGFPLADGVYLGTAH